MVATFALVPLAKAQLATTPETTEGPYYPFNSGQTLDTTWLVGADNDLTLVTGKTVRASGTRFLLSGTVVNQSGTAISGATIELWEADNGGTYYYGNASGNDISKRDTNFQSYGTTTTDSSGNWSFRTIKPGLYTGRIRHFHYKVRINGTTVLTSQFVFEEDRSQFASDSVTSSLVTAGSIERIVLAATSGVDSLDGVSALLASKQIVVNPSAVSTGGDTGGTVGGTGGMTGGANGTGPGGMMPGGNVTITPPTTGGAATTPTYALVNLSVRSTVPSASGSLIAGFVIQNGDGKQLLVRAVGPALSAYGVSGAMADPRLEIYNSTGTVSATNDNWDSSLASTFTQVGAFPLPAGSKDAALTVNLPSGAGTAVLRGNSAGIALLEAYDANPSSAARLVNFSARSPVGTGNDVLIAGFVLQGTGTARLLVRGLGPRLTSYGVTGALTDPVVEIYNSAGTLVASNDNWDATLATTFTTAGAIALTSGSKDAALIANLPAGASYTILVRGASGATGEAMLEIYDLR